MNNDTNKILTEMLKWLRLQGTYLLETSLFPTLLDTQEKQKVYEMTDGSLTVAEISKRTSVSVGSISNWWNLWYEKGIVTREGKHYQKLVSLRSTPKKGVGGK